MRGLGERTHGREFVVWVGHSDDVLAGTNGGELEGTAIGSLCGGDDISALEDGDGNTRRANFGAGRCDLWGWDEQGGR